MAKQVGFCGFRGELQGVVGFERDGRNFVKMKGSRGKRFWHESPTMIRSRENAVLFGAASRLGSGIYGHLPKPMRALCGAYGHNRFAAKIYAAGRELGRLPEEISPGVVARAVFGASFGHVGTSTGLSPSTSKGLGGLSGGGASVGLGGLRGGGASTELSGLSGEACEGPSIYSLLGFEEMGNRVLGYDLKQKERLEMRLYVAFLRVGGLRLDADRMGYSWTHEPALLEMRDSGWLSEDLLSGDSFWKSRQGFAGIGLDLPAGVTLQAGEVMIACVGVAYRAVKGGKVRHLKGMGWLQVATAWVGETQSEESSTRMMATRVRARSRNFRRVRSAGQPIRGGQRARLDAFLAGSQLPSRSRLAFALGRVLRNSDGVGAGVDGIWLDHPESASEVLEWRVWGAS